VNFSTAGQSIWGPGTAPSPIGPLTITLADATWNASGSTENIGEVDLPGLDPYYFGGRFSASTSGDIALKLGFDSLSTGAVNINLPVDVIIGLPAANSFRDGQIITIPTSMTIARDAEITVSPPAWDVSFIGRLGLTLSAGGEICVFSCGSFSFFGPSVVRDPVESELFAIASDEFRLGGLPAPLPHTLTFVETFLTGISGWVDAPFPSGVTTTVENGALVASGFHQFMDLVLDIDKYMGRVLGISIPLGVQTPNVNGAQLTYQTLGLEGLVSGSLSQTFSLTPTVYVTMALPQPVEYTVLDGDTEVERGTSASITLRVGHTLSLVYPAGLRSPLDIVPTFSLTNTFSNQTSMSFTDGVGYTVGEFGVTVPSVEIIPSTSWEGPCVPDVWNWCTYTTPAVNSPSINVGTVGPLAQQSWTVGEQQYQLFAPEEWELQGFNTVEGAPLTLDPEAPVIAVHASLGSGLASGAGPAGTLVHTIRLENQGDVQLNATQAADALTVAAGSASIEVLRIRSRTLTTNASFDGTGNQNTLAGTDALATQDTGVVSVLLTATPGTVYRASVTSGAASPIGTAVSSAASATFAVHEAEAFPARVPHHSDGVITLHIRSAPGLDAANIHPGSVRLRGVEPLDWSLQAMNGHNVLMLMFDRRSVLNGGGATGGVVASRAAPDVTLVASAVLSLRRTDDSLAVAADELGNRNGRLDLGDLRALLFGAGPDAADSTATAGTPPVQAAGAAGERVETLVLLGSWTDGTPFMAEASITVVRAGRNP
jgi:hypothetical protein